MRGGDYRGDRGAVLWVYEEPSCCFQRVEKSWARSLRSNFFIWGVLVRIPFQSAAASIIRVRCAKARNADLLRMRCMALYLTAQACRCGRSTVCMYGVMSLERS